MTELTVEVKPLTPLVEYNFEVRARNSAGPGDAADFANVDAAQRSPTATAPTAVPRLRTSLGTHAGTAADEGHESDAEITVSWDALPDSAAGGDIAGIAGYELCYKKSTGSVWMRWDAAGDAFGTLSASGSLWSAVHGEDQNDALLDPGTTYQYRARALNSVAIAGTDDPPPVHTGMAPGRPWPPQPPP